MGGGGEGQARTIVAAAATAAHPSKVRMVRRYRRDERGASTGEVEFIEWSLATLDCAGREPRAGAGPATM
jgi:hypothetical protein